MQKKQKVTFKRWVYVPLRYLLLRGGCERECGLHLRGHSENFSTPTEIEYPAPRRGGVLGYYNLSTNSRPPAFLLLAALHSCTAQLLNQLCWPGCNISPSLRVMGCRVPSSIPFRMCTLRCFPFPYRCLESADPRGGLFIVPCHVCCHLRPYPPNRLCGCFG